MGRQSKFAISALRARVRHPNTEKLAPAYFGMVMATGIVSLSANQIGLRPLALALFAVAWGTYGVLWWLTILRILHYPRLVFADLIDHLRGPGFFTMAAATSILGSQGVVLLGWVSLGIGMWVFAAALWLVLTYAIFIALTVKETKPTLDRGINGAWLLAVVATQSIAVLAMLLVAHIPQEYRLFLDFIAMSMWLWGGMLYIWLMTLIFYRYTFFHFSPTDLSPPYWINMGAMAISTLAGSLLVENAEGSEFLQSIAPFTKGFTIFYWATGTWWIPMLLILGVWRHIYKRFPLAYDPLYWGAIFPLGMYAVATHQMGTALGFSFLDPLADGFTIVALAAWSLAFASLLRTLMRG